MENMRFKVGDRVKIKSNDFFNKNKGNLSFYVDSMALCFANEVVTIKSHGRYPNTYRIDEDEGDFLWTDEMIEGIAEEDVDLIPKFGEYSDNEPLDVPTMTIDFVKEYGLPCPEGYIFKDENGNVINATKIVLEKKEKGYPKTYEECCYITGFENTEMVFEDDYRDINPPKEQWKRLGLINQLNKLLICRDAYWKIAGEEMGLGKHWEPDWTTDDVKHSLVNVSNTMILSVECKVGRILVFPTKEMRDAFYENFKEEIENCKEFL